jgi:hypothetical protein
VQYHTTTIPFTTTAPPPQPNEYHPQPRYRYRYRCGGLKPLHLPHSSWWYFRRKLRRWAPNRSPATVCSGQILCLPLYLSIFIVTLTYIHTYMHSAQGLQGAAVDIAKWTQDYLARSCSGILHTYIHTYIHSYISTSIYACILRRRQQPSWEEGVLRCHALGDTIGGAQQEVFKKFNTTINSTLLQSELYIFRILRLIFIELFVNNS